MKTLLTVLGCVIGGIVVLSIFGRLFLNGGMEEIKKLIINDVDMSKIADGVYKGSYHKGRWSYIVDVTVKDHKITGIKNNSRLMNMMMPSLSKKAEAAIIEKQSPKIDVISGATINTRAMQKAVENALASQNVH
jgi:uncharacterized protein with FMN-binding domain